MKTRSFLKAFATSIIIQFCFTGISNAQGLTWWVENASFKVMQDRPPQPKNEVSIEAARNEYEPFQVEIGRAHV